MTAADVLKLLVEGLVDIEAGETGLGLEQLHELEWGLANLIQDGNELEGQPASVAERARQLRRDLGGGPADAPGFLIIVGLEGRPTVYVDAPTELDERRLRAWLDRHPGLAALVADAADLRQAA